MITVGSNYGRLIQIQHHQFMIYRDLYFSDMSPFGNLCQSYNKNTKKTFNVSIHSKSRYGNTDRWAERGGAVASPGLRTAPVRTEYRNLFFAPFGTFRGTSELTPKANVAEISPEHFRSMTVPLNYLHNFRESLLHFSTLQKQTWSNECSESWVSVQCSAVGAVRLK
jgi:hypothetical protein